MLHHGLQGQNPNLEDSNVQLLHAACCTQARLQAARQLIAVACKKSASAQGCIKCDDPSFLKLDRWCMH